MGKNKFMMILVLFIVGKTIKAQDASNDANWEETTAFLSDNIKEFNHTVEVINSQNYVVKYFYTINNGKFKSERIVPNSESSNITASLINLKSVELIRGNGNKFSYRLVFLNNTVSEEYDAEKSKGNNISIDLNYRRTISSDLTYDYDNNFNESDEIVKKMLKAFQHLAYLATNKRSKSKF